MSALEKAAKALGDVARRNPNGMSDRWLAEAAVSAYLDALLADLPEEAVEAASDVLEQDARCAWPQHVLRERDAAVEDRNRWIILFNRLEKHVTRHFDNSPACNVHETGGEFDLDEDLELYRGWVSVMNAANEPKAAGTQPERSGGHIPKGVFPGERGG